MNLGSDEVFARLSDPDAWWASSRPSGRRRVTFVLNEVIEINSLDLVLALNGDSDPHGGIDGVIHEDALGLDSIYVQAKSQQDSVGRPALQGFVGALDGRGANKGVFITTSAIRLPKRERPGLPGLS